MVVFIIIIGLLNCYLLYKLYWQGKQLKKLTRYYNTMSKELQSLGKKVRSKPVEEFFKVKE